MKYEDLVEQEHLENSQKLNLSEEERLVLTGSELSNENHDEHLIKGLLNLGGVPQFQQQDEALELVRSYTENLQKAKPVLILYAGALLNAFRGSASGEKYLPAFQELVRKSYSCKPVCESCMKMMLYLNDRYPEVFDTESTVRELENALQAFEDSDDIAFMLAEFLRKLPENADPERIRSSLIRLEELIYRYPENEDIALAYTTAVRKWKDSLTTDVLQKASLQESTLYRRFYNPDLYDFELAEENPWPGLNEIDRFWDMTLRRMNLEKNSWSVCRAGFTELEKQLQEDPDNEDLQAEYAQAQALLCGYRMPDEIEKAKSSWKNCCRRFRIIFKFAGL